MNRETLLPHVTSHQRRTRVSSRSQQALATLRASQDPGIRSGALSNGLSNVSKPKSRLSKAKPRCPRRSRGGRGCVKAPMVASEDVLHDSWHLRRLIGRHAAAYGHAYGQTSPHAEDRMRRRQLREGVYEERPAVILGDLVAVHDAFQNKYPECKVPFESFCRMHAHAGDVASCNISFGPHGCTFSATRHWPVLETGNEHQLQRASDAKSSNRDRVRL